MCNKESCDQIRLNQAMLMKLFQLLYAGGRPSQDQAPSCNESQEELFTETDISRMSKDEILRSLGIRSKNTLSQLRITMLKFSITCFVNKLTDDEVKAVVMNLKLPRYSQEKGCSGPPLHWQHKPARSHQSHAAGQRRAGDWVS